MSTTENNILLAEFMGVWESEKDYFYFPIFERAFKKEEYRFHNDWNWLMMVVDGIENIEVNGSTFTFELNKDSVHIFEYGKYYGEIITVEGGGRMRDLYHACVEFVKWHTKETKKIKIE